MSDTIRTLLHGAVDYAGLFPPAQLPMRDAVSRYATYRSEPNAWMLGRFVVPASRLEEFIDAASTADHGASPWLLSALIDNCTTNVPQIIDFNRANGWVQCDAAEVKAISVGEIGHIASAVRGAALRVYIEVPIADDPGELIDAIAAHGLNAKVRTGGTVESAIPSSRDIARFLSHCIRARVPFKATAGLHHPIRGEYRLTYDANSPSATMFGYLNVFLAAALVYSGGSERDAIALLEERDAKSLRIDSNGAEWKGRFIAASSIAAFRREALAGFGSCSFTEPLDEIVSLGFV